MGQRVQLDQRILPGWGVKECRFGAEDRSVCVCVAVGSMCCEGQKV